MSSLNNTKENSLCDETDTMYDLNDLSAISKDELETILRNLGNAEKVAILKIKIAKAIDHLNNSVGGMKEYRHALDSFSDNLEKILKDWDSDTESISAGN